MGPVSWLWLRTRPHRLRSWPSSGGNGPGQLVVHQGQRPQIAELAQFRGNGAGQAVSVEIQLPELAELAQFGGNGPGQLVVHQGQVPQIAELAQFRGNGAGQAVSVEIQLPELAELAQFGGNGPGQLVVHQIQVLQIAELAEFGRDGTRQPVVSQNQLSQPRELAEFGRDGPAQLVFRRFRPADDGQFPQPGQTAQGRGHNAPERRLVRIPDRIDPQANNAARIAAHLDPREVGQGGIGLPGRELLGPVVRKGVPDREQDLLVAGQAGRGTRIGTDRVIHRSVSVGTGYVYACAGRRCLTVLIPAPALNGVVGPQAAGVQPPGTDGDKIALRRRRLAMRVPTQHCPVASVLTPHT